MLSVFLRATAVIAVIFFHSPHRIHAEGPLVGDGLRKGFDALVSGPAEATPLAGLWSKLPSDTRDDVAGRVAREAVGGWARPAVATIAKAVGSDEAGISAGPAWRVGPAREARRVYP